MNDEFERIRAGLAAGQMSRRAFLGAASAIGVGAATALAIPGVACAASDTPVKGGHMKIGFGGGASGDSFDPTLANSDAQLFNLRLYGETLVNASPTGALEYRVAESVNSSDGINWEITVRDGVEFHNGKSVTSEDVAETIRRHADEKSQSVAKELLTDISKISTDGKVVKIALKGRNPDFPYVLTETYLVIQPGGGRDAPAAGVGSGAYQVVGQPQPGVRYQFKKFANYWDAKIGHVDENEVIIINDPTARTAALQSRQVHMINNLNPKIVSRFKTVPGVKIKNVTGRGHFVFSMHTQTPPFNNPDLRMALKLAINREEIVKSVLSGYGTVGNDTPINSLYPLFDNTIPQRTFDPAQAAALYKKSGHDGSPIPLHVADIVFPGAIEAAQLFQQSAAQAGIKIDIRREPNDGYWSEVWNKKPFFVSLWYGRPTQDQMYSLPYLSNSNANETQFHNAEFDAKLLKARSELEPAKRKQLYGELARLLRDDGGTIVFAFNDYIDAVSDQVGGFNPDPNRGMMNNMAALKCWLAA